MQRARQTMDMAQILSILNAIAGQLDFRAVIHAVSAEIGVLLPHDHLDVAIMSADGLMVSAYETGLHTEWDAATTATKPVAVSPIRDLFRGEVDHIITDDAQNDQRFHFKGAFSQAIFAAGLRSRLHVPLKVEGRVLGALSFSTQEKGTYKPADVAQARIVADILSPYFFALHQSELRKKSELQQVEVEARAEGLRIGALHLTEELEAARQAIGMDLHDQTLADLSRILRSLKRFSSRVSLRGRELDPLVEEIEHCIRELRVLIDNAKPSVLHFFGFVQAVEAHLERSLGSPPTALRYELRDHRSAGIEALPPNTQVALYRIVQEAINNAVRHASASVIVVEINEADGRGLIAVEDDGTGLRSAHGRRSGGLDNIRTRASLIMAEMTAGPGNGGRGTRLEFQLPVPQPASESPVS
ncbi:MAG TPA: ATP-binding protein [Devosia sp.]